LDTSIFNTGFDTNILLVLVYGFIVFKTLYSNDGYIQEIKRRFKQTKESIAAEQNFNIKKTIKKLELEHIDDNLSKTNKHLKYVIISASVGMGIFYIFFNGGIFISMTILTLLLVLSESAVRQNYIKLEIRVNKI